MTQLWFKTGFVSRSTSLSVGIGRRKRPTETDCCRQNLFGLLLHPYFLPSCHPLNRSQFSSNGFRAYLHLNGFHSPLHSLSSALPHNNPRSTKQTKYIRGARGIIDNHGGGKTSIHDPLNIFSRLKHLIYCTSCKITSL